jgi:hypothetical protein
MQPLVTRVLDQTRARLIGGDTHVPDKVLSVFEPHTEAIRKGKIAKPTEFGKRPTLRRRLRTPRRGSTQRGASLLHRPRQHAHAVLQQRAVRRIVHISFYDRGVDAKSTSACDPGTLRDLDDLAVQLLDHVRPEGPRDLQNRLRVRLFFSRINARERAIDQIGADLRARDRHSSNRRDASGSASAARHRPVVPGRPRRRP